MDIQKTTNCAINRLFHSYLNYFDTLLDIMVTEGEQT